MKKPLNLLAGIVAVTVLLAAVRSARAQASESLPTAQEIFNRYAEAIGGRAAWEKLTSRVSRGTVQLEGEYGVATILVYERAPNLQIASVTLPSGAVFRQGFDGRAVWEQDPSGVVREVTGARGADMRAETDFYSETDLGKLYPHARTVGRQTVDGRDAYIVEGAIPGGTLRKLYFEVETGLRFRTETFENALSPSPTMVVHYEDYRVIDGIKYPYRSKVEGAGPGYVYRFTVIQHNVPVRDDQVARPASTRATPN